MISCLWMGKKVTKGGFCDCRKGEKISEQKTLGVTEKRYLQKRGHEGNNHHNTCYRYKSKSARSRLCGGRSCVARSRPAARKEAFYLGDGLKNPPSRLASWCGNEAENRLFITSYHVPGRETQMTVFGIENGALESFTFHTWIVCALHAPLM